MPIIETKTYMEAPLEVCFNAARNSNDIADSIPNIKNAKVDTKLNKNVGIGDKFYLTHSYLKGNINFDTKYNVIEFVPPFKFSEQITGPFFKEFKHTHEFLEKKEGTLIIDTIEYEVSFGIIGSKMDKKYIDGLLRDYIYNRLSHLKLRIREKM